jgi:NTP pyrophosphatase (non-canonical NTP hydrolase)
MELDAFQALMEQTYGEQDRARGRTATIAWLAEEIGELAQAVRKGSREQQVHELGDVLAWLTSLANQLGIGWDEAVARYTAVPGCPVCGRLPCGCRAPGDQGPLPTG